MSSETFDQQKNVNAAFSKQSAHFDEDDLRNPILQAWRQRVYGHVDQFVKPNSKILELNAGTGIDAMRFAELGHEVHATDLSNGMIVKLKEKSSAMADQITVQQLSFDRLDLVEGKFDYVFSNFGGLNCIEDLKEVTKHLPRLLNPAGFVTWVIMPRIAPWEWVWMLKGNFSGAFRRFKKNGVMAHLEGEFFRTYYHSLREIEKSFGQQFQLVGCEGLGVFSPPPGAEQFIKKFAHISGFLNRIDRTMSKNSPFSGWGDHIIVTFRLIS
jgi:ubiquinone/menaquinone biosynthesis C-methylase UbiE